MKSTTYKAVKAILDGDESVRGDLKRSALRILAERTSDTVSSLPLLLTQKQSADLLGVSRFTIRRMTTSGELHPVRINNHWRFRRSEIEAVAGGLVVGES